MNYNFDEIIDRKSTNDIKWHASAIEGYLGKKVPEEMIPMWIADTELACFPGILQAIKDRADKKILGYCSPMESFYSSIGFWQKNRFGFDVSPSWISILPTVVAGINIAIRAFSKEGEGVIIQQPVYEPFSKIIKATKRKVVNNSILKNGDSYQINFDELEALAKDENNKVMVLCSPHNPIGKVFSKEELIKIADICIENDVMLISDEIHADIVFEGNKHYPLLSLDKKYQDNFILLASPGKTFNVAGLKVGYSIIPNPTIKKAFEDMQVSMSLDIKNTFGIEAVSAAYTEEGMEYLDAQLKYMENNIKFLKNYIKENMPGVNLIAPDATFLCWLDFSQVDLTSGEILKRIIHDASVICVPGEWFGAGGEKHIRFNIGCPLSMVQQAIERIKEAVYN